MQETRKLIPAHSFNDDDVYVFDVATLRVVRQIPCSQRRACEAALVGAVEDGQRAKRGMFIKSLGLWR